MKRSIGCLILAFVLMAVVSWAEELEKKMECQDWAFACTTGSHWADTVGDVPVHTHWEWKRGGCYPFHDDYFKRAAVDCDNTYPSCKDKCYACDTRHVDKYSGIGDCQNKDGHAIKIGPK